MSATVTARTSHVAGEQVDASKPIDCKTGAKLFVTFATQSNESAMLLCDELLEDLKIGREVVDQILRVLEVPDPAPTNSLRPKQISQHDFHRSMGLILDAITVPGGRIAPQTLISPFCCSACQYYDVMINMFIDPIPHESPAYRVKKHVICRICAQKKYNGKDPDKNSMYFKLFDTLKTRTCRLSLRNFTG